MRNTEKETTVTPSRRIDKCPTLGHRFSDPHNGNRQDDKCPGGDGYAWN